MKILAVYTLNSHLLTLKAHNHKMYVFLLSTKLFEAYYSHYKKKRKLLNDYFWVKIIDLPNDSISVALSFNKDLYNRVSSKI